MWRCTNSTRTPKYEFVRAPAIYQISPGLVPSRRPILRTSSNRPISIIVGLHSTAGNFGFGGSPVLLSRAIEFSLCRRTHYYCIQYDKKKKITYSFRKYIVHGKYVEINVPAVPFTRWPSRQRQYIRNAYEFLFSR